MLAVSIEGTTIRLLEARGRKVVRWHSALFNPALIRRGVIMDSGAMAQVMKKALDTAGIRSAEVAAAFDGVGALSKVVPMPDLGARPSEFIPREARRLWSLEPEASFVFWQPIASDRRRFFVLAVPRAPLLAMLETLRHLRLKPRCLDVRGLALARAANQNRAIVVCAESNNIVLVVLEESVPVLMQTHWLGEVAGLPSAVSAQVPGLLSQSLAYYNDTHPGTPLPPDTPLLVVGSAVDPSLEGTLKRDFSFPLELPAQLFSAPPDFPWAQYQVNLGLLLKT